MQVTLDVKSISRLDVGGQTAFCDFVIIYDWIDTNLKAKQHYTVNRRDNKLTISQQTQRYMFNPIVQIENAKPGDYDLLGDEYPRYVMMRSDGAKNGLWLKKKWRFQVGR